MIVITGDCEQLFLTITVFECQRQYLKKSLCAYIDRDWRSFAQQASSANEKIAQMCSANFSTWIRTLQTDWHQLFHLDFLLDSQLLKACYHHCHELGDTHNWIWQLEDFHAHPLSKGRRTHHGGPGGVFPIRMALWEMLWLRFRAWTWSCSIL